jgi:hypothetical protein
MFTVPRMTGLATWPAAVPSSNGPAIAALCVVTKQNSVIQMIRRRMAITYPLMRFRKSSAAGAKAGAERCMYSSA